MLMHWADLAGVPGGDFSLYALGPGADSGKYQDPGWQRQAGTPMVSRSRDFVLSHCQHCITVRMAAETQSHSVFLLLEARWNCARVGNGAKSTSMQNCQKQTNFVALLGLVLDPPRPLRRFTNAWDSF